MVGNNDRRLHVSRSWTLFLHVLRVGTRTSLHGCLTLSLMRVILFTFLPLWKGSPIQSVDIDLASGANRTGSGHCQGHCIVCSVSSRGSWVFSPQGPLETGLWKAPQLHFGSSHHWGDYGFDLRSAMSWNVQECCGSHQICCLSFQSTCWSWCQWMPSLTPRREYRMEIIPHKLYSPEATLNP